MTIEIKNRWNGQILFSGEFKTLNEAVMKAVKDGTDLSGTDLSGANLSGADLYGANLYGTDLSRADLSGANLSGTDLSGADLYGANLSGTDLYGANLSGADLYGANLSGTDLSRADLYGANLSGTDLSRADLYGANLSRADLYGAKGINKNRTTALYMLLDQPGKIRAYKLVNNRNEGPYNGGIIYEIGKSCRVKKTDADTNEQNLCGAGINLATLDWCMKEWCEGYKILIAEFEAKDIAAIPIGSDGKFRVFRCSIVGEKDLKELGLEG